MLDRDIDRTIEEHFRLTKKALFLTGARQSGKTYAIRKYAKNKGLNIVELNFLLQPESIELFKGAGDVKDLLIRISAYSKTELKKGKTLIFFDEIQEYSDVVTWVKALVEDGSYIYALSGSLLGVELKDIRSVPVGYMSEYRLYPLDFEEFIRAVGIKEDVINLLRECWEQKRAVDSYIH
ncbi:MAG: AAA family ATPase, partial [Muribaculaceae bacterium]